MSSSQDVQRNNPRVIAACFALLQLPAVSYLARQAEADALPKQTASPTWLEKIQKPTSSITACRVSWKRTMFIKPRAGVDPEKRAAQILEWARKQGIDAATAQRLAEGERREAKRDIQGQTIVSLLDFVRVGKTVRCYTTYPGDGFRKLEFFDGTNVVGTLTERVDSWSRLSARLTRDQSETLRFSAPGLQTARLLLGIPLDESLSLHNGSFSTDTAVAKEVTDQHVVLERKFDPNPRAKGLPESLTLARSNGLPVAYDEFEWGTLRKSGVYSRQKGKVYRHASIEGYKQYKNGVWFPSKVTITSPSSTTEYTLLKAAFNEDVDPLEVRLPPGMRVADIRFGTGPKAAAYKPKNGAIPSDDEVRQMLHLDKEAGIAEDKASKEAKPEPSSSPIAPAAGLMFMAMGGMMWARSRKDDTGAG